MQEAARDAFCEHLGSQAIEKHGSIEAARRAYQQDSRVVELREAVKQQAGGEFREPVIGYLADTDGFEGSSQ